MEPYKIDRNSPYFTIKYFPKKNAELSANEYKIKQFHHTCILADDDHGRHRHRHRHRISTS
jgi:hypothetical protein